MKHPPRMGLFFAGAIAVAAMYALAAIRLPGPEQVRGQYMRILNSECVDARHVTNAVAAVNFDYRGFDTLGEEFIMFVSVVGTLVLLRQTDPKAAADAPDAASPGRAIGPSDALTVWMLGMTGPTVLFGIYMIVHGQLTPGGGFQGGVILATAPLLIYLAESFRVFQRITSHRIVEIIEAVGAGAYALIGLAAVFVGGQFLANVFPLGKGGSNINLFSGGTIPAINLAVAIEVSAGFVLLLYAFLEEMLERQKERLMTYFYVAMAVAAWLFLVGVYGIVTSRDLIHLCLCLVVVQASTYVVLTAVGYRPGGIAPIFTDTNQTDKAVDPVVHALMLTDIVVEATVVALLLAITVQIQKKVGNIDPDKVDELKG